MNLSTSSFVLYIAKEARELQATLVAAADVVRKGLREGAERELPLALLPGVEVGTYNLERSDYNGKVKRTYIVVVGLGMGGNKHAYLRRES